MKARYNVEVYRSGNKPVKTSHASIDGFTTLCGLAMKGRVSLYITHNNRDGTTTCPKCKRIEEREQPA